MAIDYDHLMNYPIPDGVQEMNFRDAIIYALGIGLSQDQLDKRQLRYTYEDDQKVFPSMAVVLAGPGFWVKNDDTGVDWVKVLHGEQGMEIHKPIPVNGKLTGKSTMTEIIDKGAGKGALMYSERVVYDESGDKVCTLTSTTFGRRLRRAGEACTEAACAAGPGTGWLRRPVDTAGSSPDLPAFGGLQSAARGSGRGHRRRLQGAHPARPVQLRHRLPCPGQGALRL